MAIRWSIFNLLLALLGMIRATSYATSQGGKGEDLVTNLPGQPYVMFKQYAGYVILDPAPKERALFYWFFEADHPNASSLPVALWVQGGPGCSSIGFGAIGEIGPFLMKNGTLVHNDYAWNKEVNLIFLDSPVGTGYSYTDDAQLQYVYTDENVAADTLQFLVGWLEKFPEYNNNELVLLGESYAGHYVPHLAAEILLQNQKNGSFHLNLKGFQLGNPWTDAYIDNKGTLEWYLSHSLISEETFDLALNHCNLSSSYYIGDVGNDQCQDASYQIREDTKEIDIDNVYKDYCNIENSTSANPTMFQRRHKLISATWHHGNDPCGTDGVQEYFNTAEVQNALHVRRTPTNWIGCSNVIYSQYKHEDLVSSMVPIYEDLFKSDIQISIFSGDWDGNVPTSGTRNWIKSLNLPIIMKWRPWDYLYQVGGWTQVYKGLTFSTVRAAGHMVPSSQPGKALVVFQSFLAQTPLPVFHLISD